MTDLPVEQRTKLIWGSLTDLQRQFIIKRLITKSDVAACKLLDIPVATAYNWPSKQAIDEYIDFQRQDALATAKAIIVESTVAAAGVLHKELTGRRRLTAAKEILDRAGLPAVTRQEITGPNSGPIEVKPVDYRNGIANLAPGSIPDSDSPGEE